MKFKSTLRSLVLFTALVMGGTTTCHAAPWWDTAESLGGTAADTNSIDRMLIEQGGATKTVTTDVLFNRLSYVDNCKENRGLSATPPTANTDSSIGYCIGSPYTTTGGDRYVALDVTVGAAVWEKRNALTDAEQSKLAGIAAGAEVNVNPDWNASGTDAEILNKPATHGDLIAYGAVLPLRDDAPACDDTHPDHTSDLASIAALGYDSNHILCVGGWPATNSVTIAGSGMTLSTGDIVVTSGDPNAFGILGAPMAISAGDVLASVAAQNSASISGAGLTASAGLVDVGIAVWKRSITGFSMALSGGSVLAVTGAASEYFLADFTNNTGSDVALSSYTPDVGSTGTNNSKGTWKIVDANDAAELNVGINSGGDTFNYFTWDCGGDGTELFEATTTLAGAAPTYGTLLFNTQSLAYSGGEVAHGFRVVAGTIDGTSPLVHVQKASGANYQVAEDMSNYAPTITTGDTIKIYAQTDPDYIDVWIEVNGSGTPVYVGRYDEATRDYATETTCGLFTKTGRDEGVLYDNLRVSDDASPPVVPLALSASDDFNRANGGLGSDWLTLSGTSAPQINTIRVLLSSAGTSAARWDATAADNQYATAEITDLEGNAGGADFAGVMVRADASGNGYAAIQEHWTGDGVYLSIYKVTGGSLVAPALIADVDPSVASFSSMDKYIKLTASGSTLTVYTKMDSGDAWTQKYQTTDGTYTSGSPGLFLKNSGTELTGVDNWAGGDL